VDSNNVKRNWLFYQNSHNISALQQTNKQITHFYIAFMQLRFTAKELFDSSIFLKLYF